MSSETTTASERPAAAAAPAQAEKPVVVAKAIPTPDPAPPVASDAADDPVTPPVKKAAVVAKPAPAAAPSATPSATAPKSTGAGYVAVLASVPASANSRISALQQFADMQQKYGAALQNKTPDVQEANLGEKGTYHRLVVGPPGSRDAANSVCSQLKSAGYNDCWVMAY
jgi:cell division septation protein DedD